MQSPDRDTPAGQGPHAQKEGRAGPVTLHRQLLGQGEFLGSGGAAGEGRRVVVSAMVIRLSSNISSGSPKEARRS